MALYAKVRVSHLWLVDPLARTLETYRLHETSGLHLATHVDQDQVRVSPFDAIELELSRWWADPTPMP